MVLSLAVLLVLVAASAQAESTCNVLMSGIKSSKTPYPTLVKLVCTGPRNVAVSGGPGLKAYYTANPDSFQGKSTQMLTFFANARTSAPNLQAPGPIRVTFAGTVKPGFVCFWGVAHLH